MTVKNSGEFSENAQGESHRMPISNEWWSFSANLIEMEKEAPGVYELGNPGKNVIFIGSSTNLRLSLLEHLNSQSGSCIHRFVTRYRVEYTKDFAAREDALFQDHLKTHGKLPRCNDRIH